MNKPMKDKCKIMKINMLIENNFLESAIQSKQQNDLYAEKFAREELNLILKGEEFISFQEIKTDDQPE